ncbi:MAG: hypothetical protein AAF583_13740, partial [Pseudomonadota bacterium]
IDYFEARGRSVLQIEHSVNGGPREVLSKDRLAHSEAGTEPERDDGMAAGPVVSDPSSPTTADDGPSGRGDSAAALDGAGSKADASETPLVIPGPLSMSLLASVGPGVGLADPSLAVGLSGFNYWKSPPFLNLMKQSGQVSIRDSDGEKLNAADLFEMGLLDENGYPIAMLDGNDTLPGWQQGYSYTVSIHHPNDEIRAETSGTFVVEWAGEGVVELRGFEVHTQEQILDEAGNVVGGRMTGDWDYDANLKYVKILETDPEGIGNHIRDISIVPAEHYDLHQAGALFDPRYVELIADHHTLRFMDWMGTNGSDVTALDDVMSMDNHSWVVRTSITNQPDITEASHLDMPGHLPFEVMVQLANETGTDPWFNIPLEADDAYVRALAAYVDAHLDPGLIPTFELSNEIWNWAGAFTQTREASLLGTDGENAASIGAAREYYGYRSAQIREILEDQMVVIEPKMTLGTQTVWLDIAKWVEPGVMRYFAERGEEGSMADVFDSIAVTGYFSGIEKDEMTALREAWYAESEARFAAGEADSKHAYFVARAADYLADGIAALDEAEIGLIERRGDGSISDRLLDPLEGFLRDNFAANKALADQWGIDLIQYEADSHISPKNYRNDLNSEWYEALNRSPEMGALTARMMEIFREEGGTLVNDYGDLGDTDYGLWGTRTHLADENPIAEAYDTYNTTAADTWGSINEEREPGAFLQGVTETGTDVGEILIGTAKRDYLLGRGGDDLLVAGNGTDGIHGGDGIDIALFSAASDEVTIRMEDDWLIVSGPEGEDRLVDVEILAFAGDASYLDVRSWTGASDDRTLDDLLTAFDNDVFVFGGLF